MDLEAIRKQLDEVDRKIVSLYEERMDLCKKVAEYKIETGRKVLDREREKQKLETVGNLVHSGEYRTGVTELFEQIMEMSRNLQYHMLAERGCIEQFPFSGEDRLSEKKIRVVFSGPEEKHIKTFMENCFGKDAGLTAKSSCREALRALSENEADFAVVPVENSADRMKVLNLLNEFENYIVKEEKPEKEDSSRFMVLTGRRIFRRDAEKVSICLEVSKESGVLYHLLTHFAYHHLKMTGIESVPVDGGCRYHIYIDFEGNLSDEGVKSALLELKEECGNMKLLGNY